MASRVLRFALDSLGCRLFALDAITGRLRPLPDSLWWRINNFEFNCNLFVQILSSFALDATLLKSTILSPVDFLLLMHWRITYQYNRSSVIVAASQYVEFSGVPFDSGSWLVISGAKTLLSVVPPSLQIPSPALDAIVCSPPKATACMGGSFVPPAPAVEQSRHGEPRASFEKPRDCSAVKPAEPNRSQTVSSRLLSVGSDRLQIGSAPRFSRSRAKPWQHYRALTGFREVSPSHSIDDRWDQIVEMFTCGVRLVLFGMR
ncbi:hypothetical protein C8F01DRAFT_1082350 [Mycena amicta]|nr:hypothetical protein C8F01DRAFT_1082350 [Mycena amicta]